MRPAEIDKLLVVLQGLIILALVAVALVWAHLIKVIVEGPIRRWLIARWTATPALFRVTLYPYDSRALALEGHPPAVAIALAGRKDISYDRLTNAVVGAGYYCVSVTETDTVWATGWRARLLLWLGGRS